jgi:hypothetical protein
MSKFSPKGMRDIIPFFWAYAIQNMAVIIGEWSVYLEIRRHRVAIANPKNSKATKP